MHAKMPVTKQCCYQIAVPNSYDVLCLLPDTLSASSITTTKRIIPLMRKLKEGGYNVEFQENLARKKTSPEKPMYLLERIKQTLRCLLGTSNHDIIFVSKPEMAPLAYLLSKKYSIPYVLDLDDLEKISALDPNGYFTDYLVGKAAKVFVASHELYKLYRKKKSDIVYLPNTTDLGYFNPMKYRWIEKSNEPTFIWVSDKIDWYTGCKLIFTSLSKLKKGRVVIIGSGPKEYFKELSKKLRIEQQVIVKDWIPDDELAKLYMTCHVGLLPFSDNPWTRCKCPSRLFEFMAMELPYICTVGEPAYMAKKLACGLIAKPEIEDFTDKMKYAIDHLEKLKEGAKQGRKFLLEKQDFNSLGEKLEAALCATLTH